MTEKFSRWDVVDDLETDEDMALYLDACVEEDPGDGSLIRAALGVVQRSAARKFNMASAVADSPAAARRPRLRT